MEFMDVIFLHSITERIHTATHSLTTLRCSCLRKLMSFFPAPAGQPGETTHFFLFPALVSFEQMDGVSQAWSTLNAVIPNASCCHSGFLLDTLAFCFGVLFLPRHHISHPSLPRHSRNAFSRWNDWDVSSGVGLFAFIVVLIAWLDGLFAGVCSRREPGGRGGGLWDQDVGRWIR